MRRSTDRERIEEDAARWVVRRDNREWTDADETELDAWLGLHVSHRLAFIRLEAVWMRCAHLAPMGTGLPAGVIPPPGVWRLAFS